jgi:hypothetical protein
MIELIYIFTSKKDDGSDIVIKAHSISELGKKIIEARKDSVTIREDENHIVIMIDKKPPVINLMPSAISRMVKGE